MGNVYQSQIYRDSLTLLDKYLLPQGASILVTGASGLIGSCVIDTLYSLSFTFHLKYEIYALGRNLRKLKDRFSYDNDGVIEFITQDIVFWTVHDKHFDYILHAASLADPVSYANSPVETILTNVMGCRNVLDYCKEHNKTRLIITSTFEVYGLIESKSVYKEEDIGNINFNLLRSCYPESKRCSEVLAHSYLEEYDVDYVIARLSSVYGPTMLENDSKAHAQFLRQALSGKDIILKSSGIQRRTYTYVLDVVSALLFLFLRGRKGETYNISNSSSICTISELAHLIARLGGANITYDLPSDIEKKGFSRPQDSILSCDKINSVGWYASHNLDEGISETIMVLKEIES